MRVFVTGASGFVGSAVVAELVRAGHQVLGLVRSDSGAEKVKNAGAEPFPGDVNDLENLKKGAAQCDAVIHTAFNHDFSRFKQNCEDDRKVIAALGEALTGTNKPLVVTSAVGLLNNGCLVTEDDVPPVGSDVMPRVATEEATRAVAAQGVNAYILRLPPSTHGEGDHGFVSMLIGMAKQNGESAYVAAGENFWPAAHRFDAAVLYRLIVEQQPAQKVFHAVAEQGIPFKDIAVTIGKGLALPTKSKESKDAETHFTWFLHFASMNCPSSSAKTREVLGWNPQQPGLLEDMVAGKYFE
ncbi:Nucleoside-diphosphate-sugar epimerase [Filimonas lacunae]|uniref:Nucleoside-diphosphate-sugar epimerase n=1 Tax=Filimonas lacunae TaxID=477680 RepID=A0A173MPI4_9BACT|nr:SDR family oxidoreductase [Filimonas lacunae]BAV09583.1 nucleoside-diphosphate-sugar epimerase [Filimonas lacunae]SIS75539.1 Nucleoside-diphosphate-sugar epimerase [Filimonas lacunae]